MLFRELLTVAPLNPVEVGDDWFLCDEDLEGTFSRPRPFLVLPPSSGDNMLCSLDISVSTAGFSCWISSVVFEDWGFSVMMVSFWSRISELLLKVW